MPKNQEPLESLGSYLPQGSFDAVAEYLRSYKVHLTVTRERRSILGNYQHRFYDKIHRISVNGTLNKYSFLITLLHELAHLLTFERFGNRVQPHGKEWKSEYRLILQKFILQKIFPSDIEKSLLESLQSPGASSCADVHLIRALRKDDEKINCMILVEELKEGALFMIKGGRIFKKGEKVRTRHKCSEVANGKVFLFSGVHEVLMVNTAGKI